MHGGSPRQRKPDTEHVVGPSAVCPDICPPTNYPHSYTCSKCVHTPSETCNNVARAPCINIAHEHTNVEPTNNPISDHMLQLFPSPWILWTRLPLARLECDLLQLHTHDEKKKLFLFFFMVCIGFRKLISNHTSRHVFRAHYN